MLEGGCSKKTDFVCERQGSSCKGSQGASTSTPLPILYSLPLPSHHHVPKQRCVTPILTLLFPLWHTQAPPAPAAKAFLILTRAAISQRVSAMSTQFVPRLEYFYRRQGWHEREYDAHLHGCIIFTQFTNNTSSRTQSAPSLTHVRSHTAPPLAAKFISSLLPLFSPSNTSLDSIDQFSQMHIQILALLAACISTAFCQCNDNCYTAVLQYENLDTIVNDNFCDSYTASKYTSVSSSTGPSIG